MYALFTSRTATGVLLALALSVCHCARLAGADAGEAGGETRPSIKALLDQELSGWEDAAEKQAVLRELHDVFPAQLIELQGIAERNRDEAAEVVARLVEQASHLVDCKQDEPREYERAVRLCRLEDECLALAQKARVAQGAAREPCIASLKQKLAEAFDAKQDAMKRDIAVMEAELANLRRRLSKRAESRSQLIERRALDLLGDREAEW